MFSDSSYFPVRLLLLIILVASSAICLAILAAAVILLPEFPVIFTPKVTRSAGEGSHTLCRVQGVLYQRGSGNSGAYWYNINCASSHICYIFLTTLEIVKVYFAACKVCVPRQNVIKGTYSMFEVEYKGGQYGSVTYSDP